LLSPVVTNDVSGLFAKKIFFLNSTKKSTPQARSVESKVEIGGIGGNIVQLTNIVFAQAGVDRKWEMLIYESRWYR
jgi:hypothetical protein